MGIVTNREFDSIILNGVLRQGEELRQFCRTNLSEESTPDWLKNIYLFILDWISPKDYIIANTSGSTGQPKKMQLKKKYMVASAIKTVEYFGLGSDKTALLCLSANYIAGKMMIVRAFVGGFNLLISEPIGTPLKKISENIDFVAMVPLQVYNSINEFTENVKAVIVGGGAMPSELNSKLVYLPTKFYETYGMTETVSHVALKQVNKTDGVFKALDNIFFSQDERKCLVIHASDICEKDVVTNDIVELNNKEEFRFIGRYDNIINTGGIKVIPEKIEEKLAVEIKSPFIISSVSDEKLGEMVVLVIIEELNKKPDFSQLSKFEVPKRIIKIDYFPTTETGKIKRNEVKQIISNQ